MSGFEAGWLALREPADRAARSVALRDQVADWWQAQPGRRGIIDLGAGTGAGLRWLAPALAGEQHWQLLEHDPALLAATPEALQAWAREQGRTLVREASGWRIGDWTVDCRQRDLARHLEPDGDGCALVTASALLDLVSTAWLAALVALCRRHGAAFYATLSYDGMLDWHPGLEDDARVHALFDRHQRGDKGFGPALGPAAVEHLAALLRAGGYRVVTAPSPWRLGAAEAALQQALLDGYQAVLAELAPAVAWAQVWLGRRRAAIGSDSVHTVGHQDLFAWPA
ncbi:MAG: hypothetical protein R3202_07310 [Candidatus Competibacterales bacterium]|nr:hypothetical protein [Candidatus Competibacterales bacterium]